MSIPLDLRLMAAGTKVLAPVAPGLAARLAYRVWFRTVRLPVPPEAEPVLSEAERTTLTVDGTPLPVYRWGEGPTVFLLHGWSARAAQMTAMVAPLVERGFRVVAYDAPAHGRSPGRRTDIFELRDALLSVAASEGPPRAVVAHSFGALTFLAAARSGLDSRRGVLLNPGVRIEALVQAFDARLGLGEEVRSRLARRVHAFAGASFYDGLWEPLEGSPVLVLHDRDDEEIPWEEGRHVAERLPDGRLESTEGLGHRRILRDPGVVQRTVEFVTAGRGADG